MTALAVEDAHGHRTALVSMDHCAWRLREDEWALRSAVQSGTGLGPIDLIIALTHTHSSSSICRADAERPGGELIEGYLADLGMEVTAAVREAFEVAEPCTFRWTKGRCNVAGIRDQPSDGRYIVGLDPTRSPDRTVVVGSVNSSTGTLATIVNYACHGTTLGWDNSLMSPDYVGAMREVVEDQMGGHCLFLQGADGDLAPQHQYAADPATADRAGRSLGYAVLAALHREQPPEVLPGSSCTAVQHVSIPLKPIEMIEAMAERFWPHLDARTRAARTRRAVWRRSNAGAGNSFSYPVWVWRMAGAIVVAQPGETYSAFQQELRANFPGVPIVVVSLANGPLWTYLPPRHLYEHNAYQVWHSPFAAGCHELVLEAACRSVTHLLADGPGAGTAAEAVDRIR